MKISLPWWVGKISTNKSIELAGVTGGLGSGKTFGCCAVFVLEILTNPKVPQWWAVAPTYTKIDDTVIVTFIKVLTEVFGLRGYGRSPDFTIIKSKPQQIRFNKTGQVVYCLSGDRPELMVSATIGGAWLTEAAILNEAVHEKVQTRARDKNSEGRNLILEESTPEGVGWFMDFWNFHGYREHDRARRIVTHTDDNRDNLKEGYPEKITRIYGEGSPRERSYRYGDFTVFSRGSAYWEFFETRNVEHDPPDPSPDVPILFNWDFNRSPLAWCAMQRVRYQFDYTRRLSFVALAESSGESRGLVEAVAEFIVAFPPSIFRDTPIKIYGDPTGYHLSHKVEHSDFTQIAQYLREHYRKVTVEATNSAPRIRHRLEQVNALLAHQIFLVSHKCPNLIKSLQTTAVKDGTWEIAKPSGEDWTHYSDAVGYPLYQLTRDYDLDNLDTSPIYGVD